MTHPVITLDHMRPADLQLAISLAIARQLLPIPIHYAHVHKGGDTPLETTA